MSLDTNDTINPFKDRDIIPVLFLLVFVIALFFFERKENGDLFASYYSLSLGSIVCGAYLFLPFCRSVIKLYRNKNSMCSRDWLKLLAFPAVFIFSLVYLKRVWFLSLLIPVILSVNKIFNFFWDKTFGK